MLNSHDLTEERIDITTQWRAATGDCTSCATAYLRSGSIAAVAVVDQATCIMCRNAAAAILPADVIKNIEAARKSTEHLR